MLRMYRKLPWAVAALYAPYFTAAVITWTMVSCSHCRRVWLELVWLAPGMLPVHLATRHIFGPSLMLIVSAAACVVLVAGLAAVMAVRRRWVAWAAGLLALAASALGAWMMYALVRM